MKTLMKLNSAILLVLLSAATAWGQIPNAVQHVQDKMSAAPAKPSAVTATKPAPVPVMKPATAAVQKAAVKAPAAAKPMVAKAVQTAAKPTTPAAKVVAAAGAAAVATKTATKSMAKPETKKQDPFAKAAAPAAAKPASMAEAKPAEATESKAEAAENKKEAGYISAGNRRDPFVSPVVQHMTGAGCSTGKRCLAIDQIALRGIVKSDGGMIAVVVNSVDKAYFLRENDPVFNGYVLKISGDSVVFKETVQDRLGHLSTREVVKKITTPAV